MHRLLTSFALPLGQAPVQSIRCSLRRRPDIGAAVIAAAGSAGRVEVEEVGGPVLAGGCAQFLDQIEHLQRIRPHDAVVGIKDDLFDLVGDVV
jgi:hypothetical protein